MRRCVVEEDAGPDDVGGAAWGLMEKASFGSCLLGCGVV
jgi:hypothetical protein